LFRFVGGEWLFVSVFVPKHPKPHGGGGVVGVGVWGRGRGPPPTRPHGPGRRAWPRGLGGGGVVSRAGLRVRAPRAGGAGRPRGGLAAARRGRACGRGAGVGRGAPGGLDTQARVARAPGAPRAPRAARARRASPRGGRVRRRRRFVCGRGAGGGRVGAGREGAGLACALGAVAGAGAGRAPGSARGAAARAGEGGARGARGPWRQRWVGGPAYRGPSQQMRATIFLF
jgi:hypothetical protein